jgi:predicted 3-demethylubiquinone-9 3-methyltransferase (glyoxalase superfamily)
VLPGRSSPRVFLAAVSNSNNAMMEMRKIDIAAIEAAVKG